MSEYQYYEFLAVDRPLTKKEMGELRSYSGYRRAPRLGLRRLPTRAGAGGGLDAGMPWLAQALSRCCTVQVESVAPRATGCSFKPGFTQAASGASVSSEL